jgi:hypothetical protein
LPANEHGLDANNILFAINIPYAYMKSTFIHSNDPISHLNDLISLKELTIFVKKTIFFRQTDSFCLQKFLFYMIWIMKKPGEIENCPILALAK